MVSVRRTGIAVFAFWAGLCALAAPVAAYGGKPAGGRADQVAALYGDRIAFDVFRNGSPVGSHTVLFRDTPEGLHVDVDFRVDITMLGLTVYEYRYRSKALWRDGWLDAITATVDDDGDFSEIRAVKDGGRFRIEAGSEAGIADAPLFPTNHWNADVLTQSRVLNTLTGTVADVTIDTVGREDVATERGLVSATHYTYSGDVEAEVWYDDAGRWVRLRFKGPDGSDFDYRCRLCQGMTVGSAAND
ncbi:hypothetical protein HH303_02665 [Rhodospirillaceae bacterium KN72]|uniref:DUF3108 domain-containing protein n=1 Tax=Pacificispira spongiicola TaxID=2729598 RepID=A0A7Y0DXG3_9PROT|nr:DUF6134 family protein [Pacificispira spongiicola]NMM43365.1 hypothetical protein [Pacificispira spongiicola]